MALTTPQDISLLITVPSDPSNPSAAPLVSAERRITPTWTVSELKSRLHPVTGIPVSSQTLRTKSLDANTYITIQPDTAVVGDKLFGLTKGSEIEVLDARPPGFRTNLTDVSSVEKYVMPSAQYEKLDDSVLAWKKRQGLGRFDPNAKSLDVLVSERRSHDQVEIEGRGIEVGKRCRVGGSDERRGRVGYVGEIEGLGGDKEKGCIWVGIEFDEPVGRNDGSVEVELVGEDGKKGKKNVKVFGVRGKNYGAFARPEKVEVGEQFGILDDLLDEDNEEI